MPLLMPLLFGKIIDSLLLNNGVSNIYNMLMLLLIVLTIGNICKLVSTRMSIKIGYELTQQLSSRVFQAIMRMSILTYPTISQGVLISRLTNDVRMIEPLLVTVPLRALSSWCTILGAGLLVAYIDFRYLISFSVIPLALLITRKLESKINDAIADSFESGSDVSRIIEDSTSEDAISLIRLAGMTEHEDKAFQEGAKKVADISTKLDFWRSSISTGYDVSFSIVSVMTLAIGVFLVNSNYSSVGGVVAVLIYLRTIRQPLSDLVGLRYPILRGSTGIGRLETILNSKLTNIDKIAKLKKSSIQKLQKKSTLLKCPILEFVDVSFRYPPISDVSVDGLSNIENINGNGLTDTISLTRLRSTDMVNNHKAQDTLMRKVNLKIFRGQSIAVTGKSGVGKSTMAYLSCGLLRPTKGAIFLNGQDTNNQTEEDIMSNISYISQDIYLQDSTLRNNLLMMKPNAADEELLHVCKLAGLTSLLDILPDGLDTMVGSRGKRFSGGERQRISIARALLKDADLLIMDEATSHLDSEIEQDILSSIETIREKKALLIIAHRETALKNVDTFLLLENGKLSYA